MVKRLFATLLVFLAVISIVGCSTKNDPEKIPTVDKIKLDEKQYIEQLERVYIEDTEDYLIITKKVKWETPKEDNGNTTVSFSINIPYTLHVDGVDYNGNYQLNGYSEETMDKNPKYKLTITNLTNNYDIEVILANK